MGSKLDSHDVEELSEEYLAERLQVLKEVPFLSQEQSNEFEEIEDELYRRASEDRKSGAEAGGY